jgi:hypothetical protein
MIVALNFIVPVVVLALLYVAFSLKRFWPVVVAVLFVVVYTAIQPSYLPKGTVKSLPSAPFKSVETPVVDRGLKPKNSDQYDAERNAAIEQINTSINNTIQNSK